MRYLLFDSLIEQFGTSPYIVVTSILRSLRIASPGCAIRSSESEGWLPGLAVFGNSRFLDSEIGGAGAR